MSGWLRFGSAALSIAAALCLVGVVTSCANSDRVDGRDARAIESTTDVPIAGARARITEARKLDSTLRLGFYSFPFGPDRRDQIIEAMRAEVAPNSWTQPGRGVVRDGEWLVAVQDPTVHRKIASWAQARRALELEGRQLIQTEVRVLTIRGDADEIIGRHGFTASNVSSREGESGPSIGYVVDDAALRGFLDDDGVETLAAPRLTTFSGQASSVSILSQRSYIQDYEVIHIEERIVADPVIATLEDGVRIELTASLVGDLGIDLNATVKLSSFHGMTESQVSIDPTLKPVTVELPEISIQLIAHHSLMADGTLLLFRGRGGNFPKQGDSEPWILVRSERVRPQ